MDFAFNIRMRSCVEANILRFSKFRGHHVGYVSFPVWLYSFSISPIGLLDSRNISSFWNFVDILSGSGATTVYIWISGFAAAKLDHWMVMSMPRICHFTAHTYLGKVIKEYHLALGGSEMAAKRSAWGVILLPRMSGDV